MAVNLYEAMFVVDSAKGGSDFAGTVRLIAGMLTRHGAQIDRIERWGERKLAYPIKQSKRGIYILVYFKAEGAAVEQMREDIALSEDILRVLIMVPHAVGAATGDIYNAEGEMVEAARAPVAESAFAGVQASTDSSEEKPEAEEPKAQGDEEDDEDEGDEEEEDNEE